MFCKVRSLGLHGVTGYEVTAECDLSSGLPNFSIVGLPDASVSEARDRVRAAVKNAGFTFPVSRITVNLAPADRKKGGTVYDLPILLALSLNEVRSTRYRKLVQTVTYAPHFISVVVLCGIIHLFLSPEYGIVNAAIQGMGFSGFAILAGVCEMFARTFVGFFLVPVFGFLPACFASPLAWICADLFLVPAFFHCLKRLKTEAGLKNGGGE